MVVLDSAEILAAVRRSLEEHVLPELTGSFARVQIEAALKALAEVGDRLERGDPCDRVNARIEAGVRELAESIRAESPALAGSLDAVSCTIARKTGEDERLYGSVTSRDIEEALKEEGVSIDRKRILLEEPIKKLGVYTVPVKLHTEVTGNIKVWVVKE